MKNKVKLIKKASALLLAAALIVCCAGCSGKSKAAVSLAVDSKPVYISSQEVDKRFCSVANLKEIATSGLLTLLFDENSTSIGIRVTGSEESKLWSALPQAENGETQSGKAEVLSLKVIHNGKYYHLNSQDNSVATESVVWSKKDGAFVVTYLITDEPSCIANIGSGASDETYSSAAGENILYKVSVTYTLKDGCLYSSLKWKNLGNDTDVLTNIGFLEYFGAYSTAQAGDYILVPDGSGAIIDLAAETEFDPISVSVYGNDLGGNNQLAAIVPAYGLKSGSEAFAAVIEQGAAIASIAAEKAGNNSNYNRVGASFCITPSQIVDGAQLFSQLSYSGEISICFRFLSGTNAGYAGIAAACREQLIRNLTLSTGSVEAVEHMPVLVNTVGTVKKEGFISINKKLTTFSDNIDLLTRIKSKGINNVYLRCSGVLSGGLNGENAGKADVLSSLGGRSDLQELNDYAAGLNFRVFVDVSLLTHNSTGSSVTGDMLSDNSYYEEGNVLSQTGFIEAGHKRYVTRLSSLEKTVLYVLEYFHDYKSTGFCVADAGKFLYTDYSGKLNRVSACNIISDAVAPLATQNIVMVENGNFYTLKNADVVSNIPMTCARTEDDGYKAVPFVQIILHGIVEFSGEALNINSASQEAFLRSIEYGAIPAFVFTNNSLEESDKYSAVFSLDNWLNTMYTYYDMSSKTLGDLRASRITNHYQVSSGVYCTEYEATTRVYVNYTDKPVSVSGITVEPMSFFRVN